MHQYGRIAIKNDTNSSSGPTIVVLTKCMNQFQLTLSSFSTRAKASGTNRLSASQEIATRRVPLNFPVRNVPSTQRNGRQCLNASTQGRKHQNARRNTWYLTP